MPLIITALLAAETSVADSIQARMVAFYDEVCLQTFPIDAQVDALMERKGATALTPEQVKVTLRDDPGRGWTLKDGNQEALIFLELPPYHACSVRFSIGTAPIDVSAYRVAADRFEVAHAEFTSGLPLDRDLQDLHVHATVEQRKLPTGLETLMVVDQHIIDPARRAKGETGTMLRFVHQIKTSD